MASSSVIKYGTTTPKKGLINYLILFHPHPASPVRGGGVLSSLPRREGLREGAKWPRPFLGYEPAKIYRRR